MVGLLAFRLDSAPPLSHHPSHSQPDPAQPTQKEHENKHPFLPFAVSCSLAGLRELRLKMDMDSSVRVFGKQRPLHEILGGGFVADVILWRRRHVTMGILLGTLAAWMVFESSGYTLLSLTSYVLLLLISILFVWAKAAETLNRPAPPIPDMHLSEEFMNKAAVFVHSCVNLVLTVFHKVSLGKDSKLFYRVAVCLWLISTVGGLTDFLTLGYTSLVIVLTIPALYEKYQDSIDGYINLAILEMLMYERIYEECFDNVRKWIVEKTKQIAVYADYE